MGTVCVQFSFKISLFKLSNVDCAVNLSGNPYDRTSGANIYESIGDPLLEVSFEKRRLGTCHY